MKNFYAVLQEPGDHVYTKSVTGEVRAYEIKPDGTFAEIPVAEAFGKEAVRQAGDPLPF